MLSLIFYCLIPFIAAFIVLAFLGKYARRSIPDDVRKLITDKPIEQKFFRSVARDAQGLSLIGDFEKQEEAVEAIYAAKKKAKAENKAGSFQVLNDKGEALEQVDS